MQGGARVGEETERVTSLRSSIDRTWICTTEAEESRVGYGRYHKETSFLLANSTARITRNTTLEQKPEREREIGKQASDGVEATQQLDSSTIKRTGKGVDIYILFELAVVASRCRNIYETATARPHTLSKLKPSKRVCSQLCGPDRLVIGCFFLPAVTGKRESDGERKRVITDQWGVVRNIIWLLMII